MSMTSVTLTWPELAMAAGVGVRRHLSALSGGRQDRHGFDGSDGKGWHVHIEGAAGEMALAKCLGLYWDGSVDTFRDGGDVGDIQVKTRSKHEYELIVRPADRDDDTFWLVTGIAPEYRVHGWITGKGAKRFGWLRNHGGRDAAYFVPQSALLPFQPGPNRDILPFTKQHNKGVA